ncbi:transposase [Patescibacteria group bacterium]|nr:transposase [Patescibacteria group bacterium]
MLLHRDSQKRIYFKDACYFISCKTEGNVPFFRERIFCDLFMAIGSEVSKIVTKLLRCKYGEEAQARRENLRLCKRLKGFLLFGWVLVYNHFHLLVMPDDKWNYSEIIHNLKRTTSLHINQTTEGMAIRLYQS